MTLDTLYFIIPGDINTLTGGYRYDKSIVQGLEQLGWQVELISLPGSYPHPDATERQLALQVLARLPDNAQVVFDGLAFSVLPAQLLPHSQRLRFIALVHHPLALETGLTPTQADRLKALETDALTHAHHIVTTSHSTAKTLMDDYHVGTTPLSTVCPGTDTGELASGSGTAVPNLLCVATITQRKGHRVLFDALKRIEHLPWHLHCVGSTSMDVHTYDALCEQRQALALQQRISFHGQLPDEQLNEHYQRSDLFVLCSFHEGYGMVLSEAIAHGLPIVATRGGAMQDTIPEGAGLLVEPGDSIALSEALQQVLGDASRYQALRQRAQAARQALFSWEQAAIQFSHLLKQS